MLHIRVVTPPALTGDLTDWLGNHPGVAGIVVHPGAARRPPGDAVHFDIRQAAANEVFERLRRMGLDAAAPSASSRSTRPWRPSASRAAPVRSSGSGARLGAGGGGIRAGSEYPPSFYVLLTIAGLIAAVGILTNSQILVVGAMVVGPEYSAIIVVALVRHQSGRSVEPDCWRCSGLPGRDRRDVRCSPRGPRLG